MVGGFTIFASGEQGHEFAQQIVIDPKILVGKPIVKGTRSISVEFVIDLLGHGWSHCANFARI